MTRFWTMMVFVLGLTAGCSDGDEGCPGCNVCGDGYCDLLECNSCPEDCNLDIMVFCQEDAGADTDADSEVESEVIGDDATPEMNETETNEDSSVTCEGWLDPTTSLCWQNPRTDSTYTWDDAIIYCENFSLGEHGPGSWHLPTISELRSLIRGCSATETGGSCGVTDTCFVRECNNTSCLGCSYAEGPGEGGAYWPTELGAADTNSYWSSSSYIGEFPAAWSVRFEEALISGSIREEPIGRVRCVR